MHENADLVRNQCYSAKTRGSTTPRPALRVGQVLRNSLSICMKPPSLGACTTTHGADRVPYPFPYQCPSISVKSPRLRLITKHPASETPAPSSCSTRCCSTKDKFSILLLTSHGDAYAVNAREALDTVGSVFDRPKEKSRYSRIPLYA